MNQIDKSNYLRGLLLLIGKDELVTDEEKNFIIRLGLNLGFEHKFCVNAVNDLLENENIIENPPVFSRKEIAECFIKDGIRLACIDNEMHQFELQWLSSIAKVNKLDEIHIEELFDSNKCEMARLEADEDWEIKKMISEEDLTKSLTTNNM